MTQSKATIVDNLLSADDEYAIFKKEVFNDYWLAVASREASILGRKEVLTGKAKFGIVGDGKELPQIALAKCFKKGDWRSGYYRDQTMMFALGISNFEEFFAQLYADVINDPFSAGRQMNSHYATPFMDKDGNWLNQKEMYNVSSDISCTGGQVGRALGHALASKLYKQGVYSENTNFSNEGNEVTFCTIGDASTSEGAFWEAMNAAAVMQVPLVVAVWDDGFGISVPVELQTVKGSISKALQGFEIDKHENGGIHIYTAKAWDYQELCAVFEKATEKARYFQIPVLVHVEEVTQPQGHSTSGSHERYKSKDRLEWEKEYDCIVKMGNWMIANALISEEQLQELGENAKEYVRAARNNAWNTYQDPIKIKAKALSDILMAMPGDAQTAVKHFSDELKSLINPNFSEILSIARKAKHKLLSINMQNDGLDQYIKEGMQYGKDSYETHLYSETQYAAINVPPVAPIFDAAASPINGYQILNTYFDAIFHKYPNVLAFGEDVGHIGDVNQGFAGLQDKHGSNRIFDTGIREWTIMGQAMGLAMRGFRPIAEIQYLDYLAYAFSPLSDDLATLRFRSNGIQRAPMIVRTRGHRLEGIWHAGSPMGMLINSMKGIHLCVPRNMTQAIGFYNTLLKSDDPGIVVECLNGYRLKEQLPTNLLDYCLPLGRPEILQQGSDVTVVSYGSCLREAQKAATLLLDLGVSIELIDAQTLMPFDLDGIIVNSLKKTNKIIFVDEDVPGGCTAFMMREVIEVHQGFKYLDCPPTTITANAHRTAFGSDGDYFTKPQAEDIVDGVLSILKF